MSAPSSIVVERYSTRDQTDFTKTIIEFVVVKAVNTTTPHVGETLDRKSVDELINLGVNVTIVPLKN